MRKSSLINLLINSKKAARVSSKSGCTRQINFYSMCRGKFRLVDLPGYGYSHTDSKVELKEIDKHFIYWLIYNNINFNVVLTKIDRVSQESLNAILEDTQKWINNVNVSIHQIRIRVKHKIIKVKYHLNKKQKYYLKCCLAYLALWLKLLSLNLGINPVIVHDGEYEIN
ncbi:putative GTP-binding protein EngB [Calliopsis andreniformis]|uniref:putative GTP-binding protein EngB n=1 Tax=Calliopsis andreniformis TaxID=337506 RepID=UPI003FCED43B